MKKQKLVSLVLAATTALSFCVLTACEENAKNPAENLYFSSEFTGKAAVNLKRGTYMAKTVYDTFFDEEEELAYRNLPALEGESPWSDCWRYTGLVSMMIRCNEVNDKKYDTEMTNIIEAFDYYKGVRNDNDILGYEKNEDGSLKLNKYGEPIPIGKPYTVFAVDRSTLGKGKALAFGKASVFDDQIWIAREYYNAYMLYGKQEYLDMALHLAEYIYDVGWMENVGGITWGQDYDTRHACSNAPFVKVLVDLWRVTGKSTEPGNLLEKAKNVYDFTYSILRDPSDNLYYDLVGTEFDLDRNPIGNEPMNESNKTKYTYNSGAMISAGVALYNATNEEHYLDEARATAESCYKYFGNRDFLEGYTMYPTATTTWFNLVMYIGYFDLFLADNTQTLYLDDVQKTIDYAYENFGVDGFIPVSWLVGWENGWPKSDCKNLLDHSSHAETYLLLAQYQQIRQNLA